MEAYTGFALVYDRFMDNIPYDMWCSYLRQLLEKHGVSSGLVAELGCGTGNMTRRLCDCGYDMIGIDSSEDMLAVAREKMYSQMDMETQQSPVLYLQQDMRDLELYGTVAAVVSVCDSMNYILEEKDLLQVLGLVNNYLDPGGMFIFDLKTEYYFECLADKTIAENRAEASFIWENYYDKEKKLNHYDLTIYASEELLEQDDYGEECFAQEIDGMESDEKLNDEEGTAEYFDEEPKAFLRFDETHIQRAYSLESIKELLNEAGLEFVAAYDAFTEEPPKETSERIYILAREGHQEKKLYI